MVMERVERKFAADISGLSNISYDLIATLKAKLDGITAMEIYKRDAHEAGENRIERFFEELQREDQAAISVLRELLVEQLQRSQPVTDIETRQDGTPEHRGGGLEDVDREDLIDEEIDESFPASDPPSHANPRNIT